MCPLSLSLSFCLLALPISIYLRPHLSLFLEPPRPFERKSKRDGKRRRIASARARVLSHDTEAGKGGGGKERETESLDGPLSPPLLAPI